MHIENAEPQWRVLIDQQALDAALSHAKPELSKASFMGDYWDWVLFVVATQEPVAVLARVSLGDSPAERCVQFVGMPIHGEVMDLNMLYKSVLGVLFNCDDAVTVVIDSRGAGVQLRKMLADLGFDARDVIQAQPCFKSESKKRFANYRAQSMIQLSDSIKDSRVQYMIDSDTVMDGIKREALELSFKVNDAGQFQMKALNISPSTCMFEAMSLAYFDHLYI